MPGHCLCQDAASPKSCIRPGGSRLVVRDTRRRLVCSWNPGLAMTASIGPTMTASSGSTRAIADGLKWPRFKQAAKRKPSSWAGPVQAAIDFPRRGVGPTQGVRVGPRVTVLTTGSTERGQPCALQVSEGCVIFPACSARSGTYLLRTNDFGWSRRLRRPQPLSLPVGIRWQLPMTTTVRLRKGHDVG
jgi:hypothetical protein